MTISISDVLDPVLDVLDTMPFDIAIMKVYDILQKNYFPDGVGCIVYQVGDVLIYLTPGDITSPDVTIPITYQQTIGYIYIYGRAETTQLHTIAKMLGIYIKSYVDNKHPTTSIIHKLNTSLRNPMMSISGSIDLLKRVLTNCNTDTKHIMSIIEMSTKTVTAILEDIVYYTDFVANCYIMCNSNFEVSKLLTEVVYELTSTKKKKNNISLSNQLLADSIYTDRKLVKYVLSALVGNANLYTDNGDIKISLELIGNQSIDSGELSRYQNATLKLTVEDTGIGIPYQDQDLVFNEFYKGNISAENQYTTGLKLPICKRICRLMGGDITVSSNLDGTTFTAYMNVKITPNVTLIMNHHGPALKKKTVLVLQNNVEARLNIYNTYIEYGIPIYVCSSMKDVYEFSKTHDVSMLITDSRDINTVVDDLATREIPCHICSTNMRRTSIPPESQHAILSLDTKNFDKISLLLTTLQTLSSDCTLHRSSPKSALSKPILLVEDNPDNLYMLTEMFKILGFDNLTTCVTGPEALNTLLRQEFSLVILDNIMPNMTGIEVAAEFHKICKEPLTNFAIISAGITDEDRTILHNIGVTHTLMKPYGLEDLRILIGNMK